MLAIAKAISEPNPYLEGSMNKSALTNTQGRPLFHFRRAFGGIGSLAQTLDCFASGRLHSHDA
jgi:hypothetical protein